MGGGFGASRVADRQPRMMQGMMMRQVVIYPDLEDGVWVAEVPSLPGCISQGDTKEHVIENVRDAIQTWIEGAQSLGMKVPEETFDVQLCVV